MTRISSYYLYKCPECGQGHVLPVYGSVNFTYGKPYFWGIKPTDLRVCQKCSVQLPLKKFVNIGNLPIPEKDKTSAVVKVFGKILGKKYKDPEPFPTDLYPYLNDFPFDPDMYESPWIKKHMLNTQDRPVWFKELSKSI